MTRVLTSITPATGPSLSPSARFTINGAELLGTASVRLEAGAVCTPAGGGTVASVLSVNGPQSELEFQVGSSALGAGGYSVCVQFESGDFFKVPGTLNLRACSLLLFFLSVCFSPVGLQPKNAFDSSSSFRFLLRNSDCLVLCACVSHCW